MSNPLDYTVGWICAIHTEYVAALAFLDEKHEGPEYVSVNDNNDYTLGKIGRHNVIIAVLPNGEYGLSSAASVARDILHSFPNVRIGLMVGIGGGAPTLKHDIRLGDVVVGIPNNGKGGVIQYDFGKAIQAQEFQETGFLNQPPTLLRTAVHGLMAQYESEGNQIREAINSAITKNPRLRKKYMRPEATTDRLYRPRIVHPQNNETDCSVICGNGLSNLIARSNREEEEDDDPAIHYGLIASANTLMRDALVRNEMAKKGVLCFETEAAGLMNHFPCLVIRGICDYSDSHINKTWQGYAAMAAAAYTKDLLSRIAPKRIATETKISHVLSGLYEVTQQHRDIAEKQQKTAEDKAKEKQAADRRKCLQLFRITSDNRDATYEWYKDRIDERVEDTCLWFLNHGHYQKWLHQESGPLLVTADPGCGKSVLAKYLIDYGLPQSATICYFFFKDQDQNTSRQALCAILHQLFSQKPHLIEHAMPQYYDNGEKLINSTRSLWHILLGATEDPEAGPIIIVFDALDECVESEFADLIRNLENQFRDVYPQKIRSKLKYLLTCRPYEQITSQFHSLLQKFPNIRIPGEEESESISKEVNHVIIFRLAQLSKKKRFSDKIKKFLENKLQKITHRTYLWVYLVFNYLEDNVFFKKTQKEIELIITTHPKNVNEAYEKILDKSEDKRMIRRALSIILVASRPLTLSEMNIAMNINDTTQDHTTNTFDDLDLEDEDNFKSRLRSLCGLFISIYHGKVYFLHQTAREFLLADLASPTEVPSRLRWHHSITTRQAHNTLAELCVIYLNLINSGVGSAMDGTANYFSYDHAFLDSLDENGGTYCSKAHITDRNAFLEYSAENWGTHFREAHIDDGAAILPMTLRVYDTGLRSYEVWFTIYQKSKSYQCPGGNFTELIIASYYGHRAVVKLLVEKGADIEAKDAFGLTPLSHAAVNGHNATIELLAEKGADIEAKDNCGRTPLSQAATNAHKATAELLIEKGADIEARDKDGETPLSCAVWQCHEALVELLLKKGADIETKGKSGRTPLTRAVLRQNEAIVKLLIEKGADIETKDKVGQTPLLHAIWDGHEALTKLLLEKGADIEAKDRGDRTPLINAASRGHQGIVKLLIENGADIEAKDGGQTPLAEAAFNGHEATIKLLIKKGANIEAKDYYGRTPLSLAAWGGNEATVMLLVKEGADITVKDNSGRTPLIYAVSSRHEATITLLADMEANIKKK